jgi:predicted nucleotidyltransferase
MRLVSSNLALVEVLALSAVEDLSLSEIARSVESSPSAAQRALEILESDGVALRSAGSGRPRYRLATSSTADHVLGLAHAQVDPDKALAIAAHANPAVEFLGRTPDSRVLVVFASGSRAADEARAARLLDRMAAELGGKVEYLSHDDVRRELLNDPGLRARASKMRILYGSRDRTFPDRSRHGVRRGKPLGRPNPAIKLPSRHAVRNLSRRHGLASLKLFGSAVRNDFRPDSDVDVLVRFRPGVRPTMESMASLEADLERLLARDVELTREEAVRAPIKEEIESEAVSLL